MLMTYAFVVMWYRLWNDL